MQGSVLGVLDHNVVLDDIDDKVNPSIYVAKYVDDLTKIETVESDVTTSINNENSRPLHSFCPMSSTESFESIKTRSKEKGLKINDSKTQVLSVSSAHYDTRAVLKTCTGEILTSGEELKMLGFTFSQEPTICRQLDNPIKKTNKRFFLLLRYKRAGIPSNRLRDIYSSVLRSCLEYSVPVYHPQLNQTQINQLERVQKRFFFFFFFVREGIRRQREQEQAPDFPTPLGPLQLSLPGPVCSNTVLVFTYHIFSVRGLKLRASFMV